MASTQKRFGNSLFNNITFFAVFKVFQVFFKTGLYLSVYGAEYLK